MKLLNNNQKIIPCANNSQLKQEIENEGIRKYLEIALSKKELKLKQKRKIIYEDYKYRYDKAKNTHRAF